MTINELIKMASEVYPDGLVEQAWDMDREEMSTDFVGDTLAEFIARELSETFDPTGSTDEHLAEDYRVMDAAVRDLEAVRNHIAFEMELRTPNRR